MVLCTLHVFQAASSDRPRPTNTGGAIGILPPPPGGSGGARASPQPFAAPPAAAPAAAAPASSGFGDDAWGSFQAG